MKTIRISVNLFKLDGAIVTVLPREDGSKQYYLSIPAEQLYIPQNAQGQAHLVVQLIETPNNQFSDFAVKPYVSPQMFKGMTKEQRRAIPFIGSGKYIEDSMPTGFTAQAVQAETLSASSDMAPSPTESEPAPQQNPVSQNDPSAAFLAAKQDEVPY